MDRASDSLRCWVLLCSDLAIRSGTAAKIGPEHYDREKGTLNFTTKRGAKLTLPVTEELKALFEKAYARGITTGTFAGAFDRLGRRCGYSLRKEFNAAKAAAGITRHIVPHDLRRTTAVRIMELSQDLRLVQAVLGHSTLQSTLHYLDHNNTQVSPRTLELAKLPPSTTTIH